MFTTSPFLDTTVFQNGGIGTDENWLEKEMFRLVIRMLSTMKDDVHSSFVSNFELSESVNVALAVLNPALPEAKEWSLFLLKIEMIAPSK